MKKDYCSKHSHHVADAYHWISHAEWEIFDNIHPQDRPQSITDAATDELPVDQQTLKIIPRPGKIASLGKAKFHQYLSPGKEHTLKQGYG